MDHPPNHPGALADVGFEHDRYLVSALGDGAHARVEMTNVEESGRLYGSRKSVLLAPGHPALAVCYRMPEGSGDLATEACLGPDYYRLLREGRRGLGPCTGESWRGFRNEDVAVWLGLAGDEQTGWTEPAKPEAGHGMNVRVRAEASHFHLLISCGDAIEGSCQQLLQEHRAALHEIGERTSAAHLRDGVLVCGNGENEC
jgi:hypothetical protein